jgi:lipoprotein-releasing system ATP-binding protein
MSGARLEARGLSKTYEKGGQRIEVLETVDLTIEPGERVAILGPSGSGKSTFLHVVGTLERPSKGQVWIDGQDAFSGDARDVDDRRSRRIGFVFQFHHLLPDQTALWNAAMPGLIAGLAPKDALQKAELSLGRLGLSDRLHHKPGELSGGEQQRVAIARALLVEPGLILADEPTGNLDPTTAGVVFDELLSLSDRAGSTLVVVTHSRVLAGRFDRKLKLEGRRLVPWEDV